MDSIIQFIFERLPGLSLLNGYKRKIGDVLLMFTAIAVALQQISPQLSEIVLPSHTIEGLVAVLAVATKFIGQLHANVKNVSPSA